MGYDIRRIFCLETWGGSPARPCEKLHTGGHQCEREPGHMGRCRCSCGSTHRSTRVSMPCGVLSGLENLPNRPIISIYESESLSDIVEIDDRDFLAAVEAAVSKTNGVKP